jgi:putative two-component system response regulator
MKDLCEFNVLVVDDTETNIDILVETLGDDFEISVAMDGVSALESVEAELPDIILLDIMMPGMNGYEVCEELKAKKRTRHIPVIFISAMNTDEDEAKGLALGAVDYTTKPFNPELVKARVRNHLELKKHRDCLEVLVEERTREVKLTQTVMIEGLATLAEYRDPETGGHVKRTQSYVKALAAKLDDHPRFSDELNDEAIEFMYISTPLHDLGKIGVRDNILLKPGPLTDDEFVEMKKHAFFGYEALRISELKLGKSDFLRFAREIAYSHHEKWDGSGYPQGLKGDDIPLCGRLMALADVYDALISKRVYKPPMPHDKAVSIIVEGKGSHFDPDIVDAFVSLDKTFRNIALTYADFDEEREMLSESMTNDTTACKKIEKVLLAEDNDINLAIMKSQLESLGYKVDTAVNGKEALSRFLEAPYDLVLTDLDMPEMDGYELVTEIRRQESGAGAPVPIFAITASDYDLNQERSSSLGFTGYMLKPFEIEVLSNKLKRIW